MSECVRPIDDYSSTLTTTVTNSTTDTSDITVTNSDTDATKSVETSLVNCFNENNDLLMKKLSRSGRPKYVIIDGKKIRSALGGRCRKLDRRVGFPDNDKDLVTGYLEPANPWEQAEDVSRDILISSYKESCERHCAEPLKKVLDQLEALDISMGRCDDLSLKAEALEKKDCEPLEEVLKRIQFRTIDLEASGLTDESAETLFDMIEYYESAKHVNISCNGNIGTRGWQACAQMIKKTRCLEQLDARCIVLTQQHMNILKRPLQLVSHLQILKVENCGMAGRAFVILVAALKLNTGLKELYLADNSLAQEDAIQLGSLLRVNNCLQLLDISNNNIRDEGVHNILNGLVSQSEDEGGSNKGLKILILWNNHLSRICAGYFAETISQSKSLETLNIGQNALSDDFLEICKDPLKYNTVLLQLGVQATGLMNKGIMALAEVVGKNESLQRIDLRDNHIQLTGLTFLSIAMKKNVTITQIDLDEKTWSKAPSMMETYLSIVTDIRNYCARNDEPLSTDSSTDESGSPQHRSRLSSVNSRKISLTCQTLPRSPTVPNSTGDTNIRSTMLEPKRTSGGRLRSPAPSPIPSPVASPIPSPSRNRFVVSRVSEASLSSTNSSASSSPITPPSLASSPTCFFPTTSSGPSSSSSRFRVTLVEPNVPTSPINNVVTQANTNVTIGFNYRVDVPERTDSDDSDSVFKSEGSEDSRICSESSIDISLDEPLTTPDSGTVFDVDKTITSTQFPYTSVSNEDIPKPLQIDDLESNVNKTLTEALVPMALTISQQDEPKIMEVPKQSSLERLIGLFQNPGNLFTGTFVDRTDVPLKHTIQGSVSSMVALGDRFQQYLRDTTRQPLQRSISDVTKSAVELKNLDPVKSISIDQLLNRESCNSTNIEPVESADNQEIGRRLSGVEEDDLELDNAQSLTIQSSIDIKTNNDNGETCVPVLTYKTEYSIMIGDCEDVIEDIVNKVSHTIECEKTICDNGTIDSINTCNLRDTNVFPIVDDGMCVDNVNNTGNVHNLIINEATNACKETSDKLLINRESNNNGNNCELNLPLIDSFNDNNNQGNLIRMESIEEEVENILVSILNAVPSIVDHVANDERLIDDIASEDFIDFGANSGEIDYVNNSHNCVDNELSMRVDDSVHEVTIIHEDNIVLKISTDRPTIADDLMNNVSISDNFTSKLCNIVDDLDNPQTSRSPTNLFIEQSRNIHRNSQDSGIEEANVSISDDNLEISPQTRDSFQESLDSGIDSECSSVCTRADIVQSFKNNTTEDKFYDIPQINACDKQSINNQTILIKTSVFVNDGDGNSVHEKISQQTDSQMIGGDTDMTIIGAKISTEDQMVSSSTSVE